jgi:hypothetical protein
MALFELVDLVNALRDLGHEGRVSWAWVALAESRLPAGLPN